MYIPEHAINNSYSLESAIHSSDETESKKYCLVAEKAGGRVLCVAIHWDNRYFFLDITARKEQTEEEQLTKGLLSMMPMTKKKIKAQIALCKRYYPEAIYFSNQKHLPLNGMTYKELSNLILT